MSNQQDNNSENLDFDDWSEELSSSHKDIVIIKDRESERSYKKYLILALLYGFFISVLIDTGQSILLPDLTNKINVTERFVESILPILGFALGFVFKGDN